MSIQQSFSQLPTIQVQVERGIERALFAYQIPFLPGSTGDSSPANLAAQIETSLQAQVRLVENLANKSYTAYSLRYVFNPKTYSIEIACLGRILAAVGHGQATGLHLANDLKASLSALQLPTEPVNNIHKLQKILQPFSDSGQRVFIFEVCQSEQILNLALSQAYVVLPFGLPAGDWLTLFNYLAEQTAPWFINIYLEPIQASQLERDGYAEAIFHAQNLVQFGRQNQYQDANAGWLARYYKLYQNRILKPHFLTVIQIGSTSEQTAYNLANALGTELKRQKILAPAGFNEASEMEAGFDIVAARSSEDWTAFTQTLSRLDFYSPRTSKYAAQQLDIQPLPYQERLRYLVDSQTALTAFRFPSANNKGIPGITTKQAVPSYEIGVRQQASTPGELYLGEYADRGGVVSLSKQILRSQTLIAGTTGSGKTTTCFQILGELWREKIPFLVIEPGKNIYRALLAGEFGSDLHIYTLGDETTAPFRFNPFEILPGVRVESHVSTLKICLESSMATFGGLSSLLEETLLNVYFNKNWKSTDKGKIGDTRPMPTLGEFYFELARVIDRRYPNKNDAEIQRFKASLLGRLSSLLRGSIGYTLNVERSVPIAELLQKPVILELDNINDEDKALIMLFLLTALREYRLAHPTYDNLAHVALIEEAHNVMLRPVTSVNREISSEVGPAAARLFSKALSELREVGQGLIIVDQIPGRLIEDVLKNTNTKIVHRLPGKDDATEVGATMGLDKEQIEFLPRLQTGQAAFFTVGSQKATIINVKSLRTNINPQNRVLDNQVESHMDIARQSAVRLPFNGCRFCPSPCNYRERITTAVYQADTNVKVTEAFQHFNQKHSEGKPIEGWQALASLCRQGAAQAGYTSNREAAYCYLTHICRFEITKDVAEKFIPVKP